MRTYFDSGALIKLYVNEEGSDDVSAHVQRLSQIALSPLHELEIRNALRSQLGQGSISQDEHTAALLMMDVDIDACRLLRIAPDWNVIYTIAEKFSKAHTRQFLCRSLDILHVATAVHLSCTDFVTGEERQARLAEHERLTVHRLGQST